MSTNGVLPQDARDLFETLLPIGIRGYPDRIREINAIFGFEIEGDGGGFWTLDCTSAPPTCKPGNSGNVQCMITMQHDDLKRLFTDYNAGIDLYFEGKIRITGNEKACLMLGSFFSITRPK